MKVLLNIAIAIAVITSIESCQSGATVNQTLSKPETRMEMMNQIADDSTMAKEMVGALMNSQNGKMMMQQHQSKMMGDNSTMMKMMKDNPTMMQHMMASMMESAKGDSTMMSNMCKTMMDNKEMMQVMQKMEYTDKQAHH